MVSSSRIKGENNSNLLPLTVTTTSIPQLMRTLQQNLSSRILFQLGNREKGGHVGRDCLRAPTRIARAGPSNTADMAHTKCKKQQKLRMAARAKKTSRSAWASRFQAWREHTSQQHMPLRGWNP